MKCLICEKEIGEQERCFYDHHRGVSMCMGCEFAKIVVWHVSQPDEKNGYYDTDIGNLVDMLNECDTGDGYTIKKEKMKAWKYYTLPEFTGF